ncbi:hypothetical protein CA13_42840 [Planctomycetes bacterium CA13]|uniref:Secreted protein n=1 Tax=Novipirellula herctigrandis TaxID=2527986 RepID=A0A5C5Z7M0_9BACT|nr:hypothetical protein CA13_42840 [Planctomycetes bacterium CA13]
MRCIVSMLFVCALTSFSAVGCGRNTTPTVIEPDKTEEEMQAEYDAYDKQMEEAVQDNT